MRSRAATLAALAALILSSVVGGIHGLAIEREVQTPAGLREGIRLIEEGDYAAAINVIEAAVLELEAVSAEPREMARSYFYVGVARVFVVGDDEARFAFREAQQHDPQFRPAETEFPRRVIRLWEEAGAMEVEPESPVGGEFAGTLTVVTEPSGATVYVAGQPRGETPIEIAGLRSGDHRVTIVREGYVSNSRMMALAPSRNELLDIGLTPEMGGSVSTALQRDAGGGGGGGGWWKWAALAGGGGAAALLLLPKNKPPVAGLSVTPAGSGMAGLTEYRFDGSRSSDPDNDQLTYSWDFGDGGTGSGVNTTHVYASAGSYRVTLTVSDGKEQATSSGSATVARNLDGGVFASPNLTITATDGRVIGRFTVTVSLTQSRERLSGSARLAGDLTGDVSISGSVRGTDFVCSCDVQLSGGGFSFTGDVDNGANVLRGDVRVTFRLSDGRTATVQVSGASLSRR